MIYIKFIAFVNMMICDYVKTKFELGRIATLIGI